MPKLNLQNVLFLGAAKPGAGSGGQIDYTRVVEKTTEMPMASELNYKTIYMYVGATDATYTHGYIYECQKTSITYTGTVSFEAATLSATTVTCDGDDFATFLTEGGADPTPIVSGTMTYDAGAGGWRLVGKDAEDNTVTSFLEYTEDYTDHGFVFTGTPEDGDVIAFTCTVEEDTVLYSWVRLDVQPNAVTSVNGSTGAVTVQATLVSGTNIKTINGSSVLGSGDLTVGGLPSQTGNAGKFLTTDGTDASWSSCYYSLIDGFKQQVNLSNVNALKVPTAPGIAIGTNSVTGYAIGIGGSVSGFSGIAIGFASNAQGEKSVAIGYGTIAAKTNSIQLGTGNNNEAKTLYVGFDTSNYKLLDSDGTIPAARHAALPSADGTYVLKLVIASGVPTLSWVAE